MTNDATARRLANMLTKVRPSEDGPEEVVELFPADNELIDHAAEFLGITGEQVITRLIAIYWAKDRRELVNKNMSIRWRSDDAQMVTRLIRAPTNWASYIQGWEVRGLGTWGTQMANGALSWYRTISIKTPDESSVRDKLANYLRDGGIPYHFDIISEMDLGYNRNREKSVNEPGWPDLFIPVPKGGAHGLFVELKQDSPMVQAEHLLRQAETGVKLTAQGYAFEFAFGYERAVQVIEHYLKGGNSK